MRTSLSWILGLLLAFGACSDNTTPQVKDMTTADQTPPEKKDGSVDTAEDSAADLVISLDVSRDRGPDLPQGDMAKDVGGPDGPPPILSGVISRSVAPVFDGKGTIYIGIMNPMFDPPAKVIGADLSQPNSTVRYSLFNIAPGDYEIWAFLDDNSNAGFLPFADPGDLITSASFPITVGTTPMVHDLVLNQVQGVAADAGVGEAGAAFGSLRGKISRSVAPALDGSGTLYITLHDQVPPGSQVAGTSLAAVDISSPYASETYFLGNLTPGKYYLQVFLDDNVNAFFMGPVPDKNDLTHTQLIQVHVVGGVINVQDVVLDQVVQ